MSKSKRYIYAIISGVLLALSFPPLPMNYFAFFGLVPLLLALEYEQKRMPLLMIFLTFMVYHYGSNWWISSFQAESDPFLIITGFALALIHPIFFMVPTVSYIFIRRRLGLNVALYTFPFVWLGFEWVHSLGDLAYPWLTLGVTQVNNHYWIQIADISAVWGASFLIIWANVIFFKMVLALRESINRGHGFFSFLKSRKGIILTTVFLAILFIPKIYGSYRLGDYDHSKLLKENESVKVGIIQPSINPWRKWDSDLSKQIDLHMHLQDSLVKSWGQIDFGVWSETAVTASRKTNVYRLQRWVDSSGFALLTGYADHVIYDSTNKTHTARKDPFMDNLYFDPFNSSLFISPRHAGMQPQIYHKMRLTPFGEYIPYNEEVPFLKDLVVWSVGISGWTKGKNQHNLVLKKNDDSIKIGSIICIESIYPDFCANFSRLGARMLVVTTNDAWYNHTAGLRQHYEMSRLRAIESRRYVARCGNSGVSGFISPTGESYREAPPYIETAIAGRVPLLEELSFYARNGDWLPQFAVAVYVSFLLIAFFVKKR